MTIGKGPMRICISSGKGGVGKTSLTINLAFALIEKGLRVLVVDGDMGLANVDVMLGLTVKRTIRDILEAGGDPMESIVYPADGLGVLPASSGVPEMVTLEPEEQGRLREILESLLEPFELVLVDTAAGIGPSVLWFNQFAQQNIVVLSPDPTSLTDAYALMKVLSQDYGRNRFLLVVNLARSEEEGRRVFETLDRAAKKFLTLDLHYLGLIPEDRMISQAVRQQRPFVQMAPESKASRALFSISESVRGLDLKEGGV